MMLKKILLASGAILVSSMAFADYQFTVDGVLAAGTRDYDTKGKDDIDYDVLGVGGKFYFSKVSTATGPIREAAFMGRQSNAGLVYKQTSYDLENGNKIDDDKKLLATVDYHIGDSNFLVGGALGNSKGDDYKADVIGITGGYWIVQNGLLKLTLWDESGENTKTKNDRDTTAIEVNYRQLIAIREYQLAVEGDIYSSSQDNGTAGDIDSAIVDLGAVFYLNNQLGLGVNVQSEVVDYDKGDDESVGVVAGLVSYEFNETVGISGKVGVESGTREKIGKDDEFSGSLIEFGVQGRF